MPDPRFAIPRAGVAQAVRRETAQGRSLACHKGCAACCRSHTTIPVYPLELIGITWYAVEQIAEPQRATLVAQLAAYRPGEPCPLLVDNACSVHPLRPMACRQFNVFGAVCNEGEDAYYTRRAEVLTPIRDFTDAAFDGMLPFYGVQNRGERKRLIESARSTG